MYPFLPLPITASEQQRAAEASLLFRINAKKRQFLERRLCNGRTKEEEFSLIKNIQTDVRDSLESRIRGGLSKNEVFMAVMIYWYRHLEFKQKMRLTPTQLKRKAMDICREYFIEFEELSRGWVVRMMDKLGMRLYKKVDKHQRRDISEEIRRRVNAMGVRSNNS